MLIPIPPDRSGTSPTPADRYVVSAPRVPFSHTRRAHKQRRARSGCRPVDIPVGNPRHGARRPEVRARSAPGRGAGHGRPGRVTLGGERAAVRARHVGAPGRGQLRRRRGGRGRDRRLLHRHPAARAPAARAALPRSGQAGPDREAVRHRRDGRRGDRRRGAQPRRLLHGGHVDALPPARPRAQADGRRRVDRRGARHLRRASAAPRIPPSTEALYDAELGGGALLHRGIYPLLDGKPPDGQLRWT